MRIPGRIPPRRVAKLLGVSYDTVINWCNKVMAGEPAPIHDVYRHITGYYWISREEVMALKRANPGPPEPKMH